MQTQERPVFGVNMAGFFTGGFGIATSARAFAEALRLAEVPHVLNKVVAEMHGEPRKSSWVFADGNPHAINLVHVNADLAESIFTSLGPAYAQNRYNVGIWYWELSRFPVRWLSAFKFYDEIWATSSFTADCLSQVSPVPIAKVRYPLVIDRTVIDPKARGKFDLRQDIYVFFFWFDFRSVFERKNPIGLLKAFRKAFERDDKALLVLGHINSAANPAAAEALKRASSGLNVKILAKHLSERDYLSLLAATDCYVSLHRSEGLGITMAEAMYFGKPVIATAYSGNMDFMNLNNSLLINYKLVELDKNYGPYEKGNVWAEPDAEQAAESMRWAYDNQDEARKLGEKGSADIKQNMNPTIASQELRTRLEQIYQRFTRPATAREWLR
jgi:glycosyltransferase involved in cell wall biosynthesis